MATFTGWISKITTKSGPGKRGPWTLYSCRVEKTDGTEYEDWLSFGFDAPPCKEGDYVKLEAEKNNKGYWQISAVEQVKNPPAKATAIPPVSSTAGGSSSYVENRQQSITYQSARKDAIEVLNLLIARDALPMTTDKAKAGQAKRYEEIMALVDKLTVRYFNDTQNFRVLEVVADEGITEEAVVQTPSGDEQDDA